jgi:hypothetical protein
MKSMLALITAAWGGACAAPVYDSDLGVEGVPVERGALAGAFVLYVQATDKSSVPGLENEVGGGFTLYAVDRSFDDASGAYAQSMRACQVHNFEVAGLTTVVARDTALAIPPIEGGVAIDDATGAVAGVDFLELWAVDETIGATDPLPEKPGDPGLVDMEGDGKPGATLVASGFSEGEIYVVNRKTITLSGVMRGPDESFGLTTHKKEGFVLEATDPILDVDAARTPHPDPKESWWHELRLAPAGTPASCDDVDAAFADGTLSPLRPFT